MTDSFASSSTDEKDNIETDCKNYLIPELKNSSHNSQNIEECRTPSPVPENACKNLNVPFGVRYENNTFMIGNSKVRFLDGSDTPNKNMTAKIVPILAVIFCIS